MNSRTKGKRGELDWPTTRRLARRFIADLRSHLVSRGLTLNEADAAIRHDARYRISQSIREAME